MYIFFSFEQHASSCARKTKVQNMFQTKPTIIAIIVAKPYKPNNVLVNVVVVTTHSQVQSNKFLKNVNW
jgi:hypothetical protein